MLALLLHVLPHAHAQSAPPVRRTRLVDGREFVAEVLGTEATGLRVRVPAGEMLVSFEDLLDLKPIDPASYAAQSSWRVVVSAPEDLLPAAQTMLSAMPGVLPKPVGQPDDALEGTQATDLAACQRDVACMHGVVHDLGWMWLLAVDRSPTGGLVVTSLVNTAERTLPISQSLPVADPASLWQALHTALQLSAPKAPPPAVTGLGKRPGGGPKAPSALSKDSVVAASYVPIPGYPCFKLGDGGRGAAALGGAVLFGGASFAAGWATATQEGGQATNGALFGVAGFFGSTWVLNSWLGMKAWEDAAPKATLVPGPNGVMLAGRF